MEPLDLTLSRRRRAAGDFGGRRRLAPVAEALARRAEQARREPAQSVILLWLAGGPSQLETFDPHPGAAIAAGTQALATAVAGMELAAGFERLAGEMRDVSLVRSLVSKEGDHERGTYLVKTGYRPDATLVHPSIGAICCHELPSAGVEIPRHVSILPNQWPARGGYLGNQFDAFKTFDPADRIPDVALRVSGERQEARLRDRVVVDAAFLPGRRQAVERTRHGAMIDEATALMDSRQLRPLTPAKSRARCRPPMATRRSDAAAWPRGA